MGSGALLWHLQTPGIHTVHKYRHRGNKHISASNKIIKGELKNTCISLFVIKLDRKFNYQSEWFVREEVHEGKNKVKGTLQ